MRPVPHAPATTLAGALAFALAGALACNDRPVYGDGLVGEPIELMSGDASPLPRLAFIDEGCPGEVAAGGCAPSGDRQCRTLLLDSLAPLTAFKQAGISQPEFSKECFEVRESGGLAAANPTADAFTAAVARYRFREVPLARAPADGTSRWQWSAGAADAPIEPDAVLGGNVLRQFSIALRTPRDGPPSIEFYIEFPGSDRDLADQGRAYIAVQFPGSLLGFDTGDRCEIGDDDCLIGGYDIVRGQPNIAIGRSRMVIDACVAAPPCAVDYTLDVANLFAPGECTSTRGLEIEEACVAADARDIGGVQASLVVATSVPGIVLFDDGARRMFGDLAALPACDAVGPDDRACLVANDGVLALSGWPIAGADTPLPRLRVRSLGLVAGLTQTRDVGPCERLQSRRDALLDQCERFGEAIVDEGDVRNTTPPYSADPDDSEGGDAANASIAVFGETSLAGSSGLPDTSRWIEAHVVPATHPLVGALRQDVVPEAIQPDGLIGTAILSDAVAVLDYTDPNPGLRMSCLDPRAGGCMVAPDCARDGQAACCHGLPLSLLVDFILGARDETCCTALSAAELAEIQAQAGVCLGVEPP
jgi:hypothetical protein